MKRLITVTVGLAFAIGMWSGPAWAESELAGETTTVTNEPSHAGQWTDGDPIGRAFSEVQSTLSGVGASSPLRSLINVIAAQLAALEVELAQLYDDLFVETCPTCDSD